MKAIAFADSKFMPMAEAQAQNFARFDVDHEIISIPEQNYDMNLWMYLLDQTIEAVRRHGKIFRVDAEIRLLKPLPDAWKQVDNVLFYIDPIITYPWYYPINTGHMILSTDAIPFLELIREMTLSVIPPGYDGYKIEIMDEEFVAPALRLSKLNFHKEIIDYDRKDESTAACTRGDWFTDHTIFTHGFMHNWETARHDMQPYAFLRDNLLPNKSVKIVDAVIMGLQKRITNINLWASLGFDEDYHQDGWFLDPSRGAFWHRDHPTPKFIEQK